MPVSSKPRMARPGALPPSSQACDPAGDRGRAPGLALRGLLLLSLSACASPDPKLYTLIPTDPATAFAAPAVVLELHRVDIPGYADRPEIVRSAADYRVHLATNERWSEPFGDLLQRVLTADLSRRLPGAVVYSDAGAISAPPTSIVAVNLSRIDADAADQVVLDAQFSIRAPDTELPPTTRTLHLTAPIAGPATTDYAAALSTVTGQLADAIAAAARPAPPAS
jgi:uncharacterized lipoprotein YmbA